MMRSRALRTAAVLLLSWTTACATAAPVPRSLVPRDTPGPFIAGYHTYWTGDSWRSYPLDVLDELFFFETEAGSDGSLEALWGWPDEWTELRSATLDAGVQFVPTVSMHDPDAFETLFPDARRVDRLVESTLDLLAADSALAGIHLDFEVFRPVSTEARDGFTGYVAALAEAMDARYPGKSLSVFALAFDGDDVYNERALGQLADYLVVQGYDYFSAGSESAGPVGATTGWGALNWQTVVERFDDFGVPRHKLVMGVPLYGYEWPVVSDEPGAATRGEGRTVPFTAPDGVLPDDPRAVDRVREHGVRRDEGSGIPWYSFESDDGWVQGWFDDAESLRTKYQFVLDEGLGGIAFFPLAYGTDMLWEDVRRTLR
jgi:spore germination protein YaaH